MMTNHGFYVVLSSTAFQRTIKELKWENLQLAMKTKVEHLLPELCFPWSYSSVATDSLNEATTRTSYSEL